MPEVKLISITPNAEQLIAYCARVSNPDNQDNEATAGRLLKYMLKHGHYSPFEMAHAVLEIKAPRDITRQILRHRSFSFQEFSQRYAQVMDFTDRLPRLQDSKNRQNSLPLEPADWRNVEWAKICVKRTLSVAKWCYEHALEMGIAKEVARVLLPEGLTQSTLYMAGSIRSWIHYCQLRMQLDTQVEHREIAHACWEIITKELPVLKEI